MLAWSCMVYTVYFLVENLDTNEKESNLLCSKTRVAPLKPRTLPELELLAAVIGSRLLNFVKKELKIPIDEIVCWSDSQIVIEWIRKPAYKWEIFVSNRVAEIQKLTNVNWWRHVESKENPSDLCSRGISAEDLANSSIWWHGPKFLLEDESNWPIQTSSAESWREAEKKMKKVSGKSYVNTSNKDECEGYISNGSKNSPNL